MLWDYIPWKTEGHALFTNVLSVYLPLSKNDNMDNL